MEARICVDGCEKVYVTDWLSRGSRGLWMSKCSAWLISSYSKRLNQPEMAKVGLRAADFFNCLSEDTFHGCSDFKNLLDPYRQGYQSSLPCKSCPSNERFGIGIQEKQKPLRPSHFSELSHKQACLAPKGGGSASASGSLYEWKI